MILAYFIECACPPDRRSATVGAGSLTTLEVFRNSYPLNHIVCGSCDSYFRLIGYIGDDGVERRVDSSPAPRPEVTRRARRRVAKVTPRRVSVST